MTCVSRARLAFVVVSCALALGAACSSYSGSGGDGTPPGSEDGGSDSGATSDAGNDGPSSDAGPDGPWCQVHAPDATFCDDFDQSGTFTTKWTGSDSYNGKIEVVASDTAVSRPDLLRITFDPIDDVTPGVGYVLKKFPNANAVTYAFDVRVDRLAQPLDGSSPNMALFRLIDLAGNTSGEITIDLFADGTSNFNQSTYWLDASVIEGHTDPFVTFTPGTWRHVAITATFDVPEPIVHVDVDGTALVDHKTFSAFTPGALEVYSGASYEVGANDGWQLSIDNVTIDVR
jgi:hypothetical protein